MDSSDLFVHILQGCFTCKQKKNMQRIILWRLDVHHPNCTMYDVTMNTEHVVKNFLAPILCLIQHYMLIQTFVCRGCLECRTGARPYRLFFFFF